MKQQGKGIVLSLSEVGVSTVLLAFISDVHLDWYFPQYACRALLERLNRFQQTVSDLGQSSRGILLILGDFIDFLTMGRTFRKEIPTIQRVLAMLRRLQDQKIQVVLLKGNHDRILFDKKGPASWWEIALPDAPRGDWCYFADDWLQLLTHHGHIWDITNREVFDDQGRPLDSLGDLVVQKLVVPLQSETCPDLNRVEPLYHIPLYLLQRDPSRELLHQWVDQFGVLVKSPEYRRWRRHALPFGQRIIGSILPLLYDAYHGLVRGEPGSFTKVLELVSQFDRQAGDYMVKRQVELVTGRLERHNCHPEWAEFAGNVRWVVTGHTHDSALATFFDGDGQPCGRISTGSWVKRLRFSPESKAVPVPSLTDYQFTWSELLCSVTEKKILEIRQDAPRVQLL